VHVSWEIYFQLDTFKYKPFISFYRNFGQCVFTWDNHLLFILNITLAVNLIMATRILCFFIQSATEKRAILKTIIINSNTVILQIQCWIKYCWLYNCPFLCRTIYISRTSEIYCLMHSSTNSVTMKPKGPCYRQPDLRYTHYSVSTEITVDIYPNLKLWRPGKRIVPL